MTNLYRALKDSSWCVNFKTVSLKENEFFSEDKIGCEETLSQIAELGYAEVVESDGQGDGAPEKSLEEMTKAELISFAKENFNAEVSGNKSEILKAIDAIMNQSNDSNDGDQDGDDSNDGE